MSFEIALASVIVLYWTVAIAAGRNCANCQLYPGKAGEAWGACGAVGGKPVNAKGWCVAWARKA